MTSALVAALLLCSFTLAALACNLVQPAVAAFRHRQLRLRYPTYKHSIDPATNRCFPLPPVLTRLQVAEKFAACAGAFALSFVALFAAVSILPLPRP